jgi:hypothetical protein
MPDCEFIPDCTFYHNDQMKGLEAVKEMMKQKYCKEDNSSCAIYMVFLALGKGNAPADLIPNQVEKAQALIAQKE